MKCYSYVHGCACKCLASCLCAWPFVLTKYHATYFTDYNRWILTKNATYICKCEHAYVCLFVCIKHVRIHINAHLFTSYHVNNIIGYIFAGICTGIMHFLLNLIYIEQSIQLLSISYDIYSCYRSVKAYCHCDIIKPGYYSMRWCQVLLLTY